MSANHRIYVLVRKQLHLRGFWFSASGRAGLRPPKTERQPQRQPELSSASSDVEDCWPIIQKSKSGNLDFCINRMT
jgi:hypothetical protein